MGRANSNLQCGNLKPLREGQQLGVKDSDEAAARKRLGEMTSGSEGVREGKYERAKKRTKREIQEHGTAAGRGGGWGP